MNLTILKYNNRKLYISSNLNDNEIVKRFGGGYTTLSFIRSMVSLYPELKIKVLKKSNKADITKQILTAALVPQLFTVERLHNLIRSQAQFVSECSISQSGRLVSKSGIEL